MSERRAIRLTITGRVQGVGFRPSVWRLAHRLRLAGSVCNTGRGVLIELEGPDEILERFRAELRAHTPTLAHISSISVEDLPVMGREDFAIRPSQRSSDASHAGALVPYDVATCAQCLAEMHDPADRRHRYPFINCTLCGPRYTIIESVPYDREKTSMKVFPMCADCLAEYRDPTDRRYHAQPNACPACGPGLRLVDGRGRPLDGEPVAVARDLLRSGRVLAVRGLGGFHLAVDGGLPDAVRRLRERKRRGPKPFAVMSPDLHAVRRYARVSPADADILQSNRRPIVLLDKADGELLAAQVAPNNPRVGAMLPYTPLHHLLVEGFDALVMTSGNLSEEPIARENDEALSRLAPLADAFLLHDRDILMACDDSVVYARGERPALVRRSRGWAPDPVEVDDSALRLPEGILAVGAQMKNTFCLTREQQAFLSQHVGDLDNPVTYEHFLRCLDHLERLLGIRPTVVACDRHPDYQSTRLARSQTGVRVIEVQHHHAHLAACMADRGLAGEVIALTLDGTGLGEDDTVWGGEVLVGGYASFRRAARLRPFSLPGSEAAIHHPWRAALGLVLATHGFDAAVERIEQLAGAADADHLPHVDWPVVEVARAAERGVNTPWTSSLGRLFDAVSALLSICTRAYYDGQAAQELEATAGAACAAGGVELALVQRRGLIEVDPASMVAALLTGLDRGVGTDELAAGFHDWLVNNLTAVCERIRRDGGPDRVVCSGGCFANRRLDLGLERSLHEAGFEVFVHRRVPANDGGLCLGQAAVAAARLRAEGNG